MKVVLIGEASGTYELTERAGVPTIAEVIVVDGDRYRVSMIDRHFEVVQGKLDLVCVMLTCTQMRSPT